MSILSGIWHALKKVFGEGEKIAEDIGPILGFFFPGWGTLFNLIAGAIAQAEHQFNPDGTVSGNGPLKKAYVRKMAEMMFLQYEKVTGNTVDRDAFIDGVVMAMNATKSSVPAPDPAPVAQQ